MSDAQRRYLREFIPAMAGYCLAILASTWLLGHTLVHSARGLRAAVGLLPVLPLLGVVRAMLRKVRDSDELQRRIALEAAAVAGVVVGLGYFSAALLVPSGLVAVDAQTAMLWVFPLLCLVYGLARLWTRRRYG
jgi:peptidoglycan/LPS O-acetylase OafA/YrhL